MEKCIKSLYSITAVLSLHVYISVIRFIDWWVSSTRKGATQDADGSLYQQLLDYI